MKVVSLSDLKNHRKSYQVIVSYDIYEVSDNARYYKEVNDFLNNNLNLSNYISKSEDEGGKDVKLPFNTFAGLYDKDSDSAALKDYISKEVSSLFKRLNIQGKIVIIIADNWSVGLVEIP